MNQEVLQTTTITIQGKSYEMRCPNNEVQSLEHAALLLNEKIEQRNKKPPTLEGSHTRWLISHMNCIAHERAHKRMRINKPR